MTIIPRFMVCVGEAESAVLSQGDFVAVDVPMEGGATRRGALMYSTRGKAQEFIAANPREWYIRRLDYATLREFLIDPHNRSQFDCVVIDFPNSGKPCIAQVFDAAHAVEWIEPWHDHRSALPSVETWQVCM